MGDPPVEPDSQSPRVIPARPITQPGFIHRLTQHPRLDLTTLSRRDAALDLALVLMVGLVAPWGYQLAVVLLIGLDSAGEPPAALLVIGKYFDALLVIALAGYFIYRQRLAAAAFGLQLNRLNHQVLWSAPTLAAMYAVMLPTVLAIAALVQLFPALEEDLENRREMMEFITKPALAELILLLIPVAIHEELLFRGLLIPYLRRAGCGWGLAIFISTAIFAVLHVTQGWLGVIQIFGVGAVLGVFFVLSRSLLAVIIAHFLFDLLQTQLARFLLPWLEDLAENA
ncbi:MAG: CPBP family intramembrane metalloprotease [Phycisphaerae bacterium]|nr:CPBP family intramembrane metalloprotease [Phycisphaerae bacterium]